MAEARASGGRAPRQADVFAIFGITGDLAKVMTFRSLYRLERGGLLDCPIVGVAVDDWTVDQLVQRARDSIVGTGETLDEATFARLAARFSYVQGDFGDAATYGRVGGRDQGRRGAGLLPRDPAFPLLDRRQGALRGRADERPPASSSRSRSGTISTPPGARRRAPPVHRRVAAPPHRPLPREDGDGGDHPPPVRERDARAGLEPELRRVRPDHDGGGLRRRGSRPLLRPRRRPARRRRQPPDAGGLDVRDGGARPRRAARRSRTRRSASSARSRRPTRRTTSAASTTDTARSTASRRTRRPRRTQRCGSRSRTGAGPASPSTSARASGSR